MRHSRILFLALMPAVLLAADGPEYTVDGQLKFPEHYREWVFLSTGVGMTYGPLGDQGRLGPPMFDNIFVNPEAYRSFMETGRWPDKTMLVMEARFSESHASINNGGHFQTDIVGVEANVKSGNTWSFYGFPVDGGKHQAASKPVPQTASCYTCHGVKTAVENTFVQFYPVLYDVAEGKGTLNPGFEKLPVTPGKLLQTIEETGWSAGLRALQDAAQRAPDSSVMQEFTLNMLGYRLLGKSPANAVNLLQFAANRYPQSANLQDSLAEANEKIGNPGAARAASQRSLAMLKDDKSLTDDRRQRLAQAGEARLKRIPAPPRIESHGALPAVSPDGSRIAFVAERGGVWDVFTIAPDGSGEFQVTRTPEGESVPTWMVDGNEVVFTLFAGGKTTIYAVGPDGKQQRVLAAIGVRSVRLSPDGKQLMLPVGTYPNVRLAVAALDGSGAHELTDGSVPIWGGAWSADSKRIAYTRKEEDQTVGIWVMNADGSGPRRVAKITEDNAEWPAWSFDGRKLAVQAGKYGPQEQVAHIWTIDVETGAVNKLAPHDEKYLDETPSWFPDGKRLAFQSNRTGRMEIWVMNADGSGARQVTK